MKDEIKKKLGEVAANLVENNTIVGLGTGTTANCFIQSLAERCAKGLKIKAVASSKDSYNLAKKLNINVLDITKVNHIDIYIDGADQVDKNKNMIKGQGAAFLREKILASSSRKVIIMIDESKYVEYLGNILLPVEVTCFASHLTKSKLEKLVFFSDYRKDKKAKFFMTENNNYILDIRVAKFLKNPEKTHQIIQSVPGVVDTGIFVNLAHKIILGKSNGEIKNIS